MAILDTTRLTVALCLFACFVAPLDALSTTLAGIRISRFAADTGFFDTTNANRLTEFLMDATYGACRPFTPAWAQRAVVDAAARADLSARLSYYQNSMNNNDGVSSGAIFVAEDEENEYELVGFVDVGACLWVPEERQFQLPMDEKSQRGASAERIRPYVSNLVVDGRARRRGVGTSLMAACEAEVAGWIDRKESCAAEIILEVTTENRGGIDFYRAAGYAVVEGSIAPGTEMVREGGGFRMADVQRCQMRKELGPSVL